MPLFAFLLHFFLLTLPYLHLPHRHRPFLHSVKDTPTYLAPLATPCVYKSSLPPHLRCRCFDLPAAVYSPVCSTVCIVSRQEAAFPQPLAALFVHSGSPPTDTLPKQRPRVVIVVEPTPIPFHPYYLPLDTRHISLPARAYNEGALRAHRHLPAPALVFTFADSSRWGRLSRFPLVPPLSAKWIPYPFRISRNTHTHKNP